MKVLRKEVSRASSYTIPEDGARYRIELEAEWLGSVKVIGRLFTGFFVGEESKVEELALTMKRPESGPEHEILDSMHR